MYKRTVASDGVTAVTQRQDRSRGQEHAELGCGFGSHPGRPRQGAIAGIEAPAQGSKPLASRESSCPTQPLCRPPGTLCLHRGSSRGVFGVVGGAGPPRTADA